MDTSILIVAGSIIVAAVTGALVALREIAPHTETKLDDKAVEYGDKALPYMVRVLEWLRGRAK